MTRSLLNVPAGAILAELGDGLVLRRSTRGDAAALADFNKMIHRDPGVVDPDEAVGVWTRDLLERPHPTFGEGDYTIVEDTRTGQIVSTCNLISQTWSYAGIPFGVGRPELVGTAPEYRHRGLVRAQFEVLHQWSAERGELAQAITGIPYYYRQFGYEMAVDIGGGRIGYDGSLPRLKPEQVEPYRLRPATDADAGLLVACDVLARSQSLLLCDRDAALWRYEVTGKSEKNANRLALFVIESAAGEGVGVVGLNAIMWGTRIGVQHLELLPGVSWLAVAPSILRGAWAAGQAAAAKTGKSLESVQYALGSDHPLYRATVDRLPHVRRPYAWYLRVPDVAAFVQRIAPVLEGRLADSLAVGYTGELRITFYRGGLRLVFEGGHIRAVENWQPDESWHASLPGLTFVQLLFGYRSLTELRFTFPDCMVNGDDGQPLLDALFPKQASRFWPIS